MTTTGRHRLDLALLWHMHQPDYRDHASGEYMQPWVYLHAIKDYSDMAAHLERHPGVRAVVNFVPVLLDQIEDYAAQFAAGTIRDPLLRLLARDDAGPLSAAERRLVITQCFRANHEKMVQPYPAYLALHDLFKLTEAQGGDALDYLSDRYFHDLLTWYHLAWTGETVRREAPLVARLMAIGAGFTRADRGALFELIGSIVAGIIPRYAALASAGRIELSTTPHGHPLAPLLIDFATTHQAMPGAPLPPASGYPGGTERVRAHLDVAIGSHIRRFGAVPAGVWPAEGAVSEALVGVLAERGCRWAASGEGVLANSLRAGDGPPRDRAGYLYHPYRIGAAATTLFFRDDRLSDLIGFEYARWNSADAAASFVGELEAIARAAAAGPAPGSVPLVSVILDGENCWEYYPYNGFYFLDGLYAGLAAHADIRTTTFDGWLREHDAAAPPVAALPRIVAGSWVYGSFSTWIGSAEKNRAWDLLCAAKRGFDLVMAGNRLPDAQREAAVRQLADCESSDWFWWMGDYNPAFAVASFDRLFRAKLARLYALLELPAPAVLDEPISRGGGHPESGGAMRRGVQG